VRVVCAPALRVTLLGGEPQLTPPEPLQAKLNVFEAEPLFLTVNVSLCPPVLAVRVVAVAPSGVTATAYETMGTE
jgi:hypothetical protein